MPYDNQTVETCRTCKKGKTAFSYCFVCQDYLCSKCDKVHRRLRATKDHRRILLQNGRWKIEDLLQKPVTCTQRCHEGVILNHYCQQCNQCICEICYDEGHRQHDVVDIKQAAREGTKQLEKALKKAEEKITASKDEMRKNEDILESGKKKIGAARKNVKANVKKLIKSLKKHKKAVLTEIDDIYEQQQKSHEIKQRKLELFITRLRSPVEFGEGVLRRKVDVEIVKEKEAIIDRCEDLLNSKETKALELPFVNYVIDEEMCQSVQLSGPGKLIVSTTDPSQSSASGEGLKDPVAGKETKILVRTRDSGGNQCYNEDDQVEVKIQSPLGNELDAAFQDKKDGRYKVTFTPELVGQHDVMVRINGQPLTDSPWSVQVTPHQYQMTFKLGTKIQDDEDGEASPLHSLVYGVGRLYSPRDVAVSQVNGNIAVLDSCDGIHLYDADGKYLRMFGKRSTSAGSAKRLKNPQSVAFSASGDIIVIDSNNITLCTEEGIFVRHFMKHTNDPRSISVARDGRVIVCDNSDAQVKVLSPNGEDLLQCFGDPYTYGSPSFAVRYRGKYFVSYQKDHCVSVFNGEGTFLYDIGTLGRSKEKLNGPLGLAVDKFNNLIVCDSNASRLQVFTLEGKYVTTITGFGSPQFVAVSKDGQLYVVDSEKKCVHVLY